MVCDRPTNQPTDQPTDIATYRSAIADKNTPKNYQNCNQNLSPSTKSVRVTGRKGSLNFDFKGKKSKRKIGENIGTLLNYFETKDKITFMSPGKKESTAPTGKENK